MGSTGSGTAYTQQYPGQEASGRDDYGSPTYERYEPAYAGQASTGRDAYGNPTYD
jgi:hypothetical protein